MLSADLLSGLILGLLAGFLLGPLVRSWLSWREWVRASREADLIADVMDRMDLRPWAPAEESESDGESHLAARREA